MVDYNTTMTASLLLCYTHIAIYYKVDGKFPSNENGCGPTVCKSAKSFPSFLKLMINRWWWVRYTTQGVKLGIDLTMSIKREVVVLKIHIKRSKCSTYFVCTYVFRSNTYNATLDDSIYMISHAILLFRCQTESIIHSTDALSWRGF